MPGLASIQAKVVLPTWNLFLILLRVDSSMCLGNLAKALPRMVRFVLSLGDNLFTTFVANTFMMLGVTLVNRATFSRLSLNVKENLFGALLLRFLNTRSYGTCLVMIFWRIRYSLTLFTQRFLRFDGPNIFDILGFLPAFRLFIGNSPITLSLHMITWCEWVSLWPHALKSPRSKKWITCSSKVIRVKRFGVIWVYFLIVCVFTVKLPCRGCGLRWS